MQRRSPASVIDLRPLQKLHGGRDVLDAGQPSGFPLQELLRVAHIW